MSKKRGKMYMTVPKQYDVLGMTISVKVRELPDNNHGEYHANDNLVLLAPQEKDDLLLGTFWHEWVHSALTTLGYEKLNDDDVFVERLAQCIHQFWKTRKG